MRARLGRVPSFIAPRRIALLLPHNAIFFLFVRVETRRKLGELDGNCSGTTPEDDPPHERNVIIEEKREDKWKKSWLSCSLVDNAVNEGNLLTTVGFSASPFVGAPSSSSLPSGFYFATAVSWTHLADAKYAFLIIKLNTLRLVGSCEKKNPELGIVKRHIISVRCVQNKTSGVMMISPGQRSGRFLVIATHR